MAHSILHTVLKQFGPKHQNIFKSHIAQHQRIPADHLRSADMHKTAHLMVHHHGQDDALMIMFHTLKKMNKKLLIRHFKELVKEGN